MAFTNVAGFYNDNDPMEYAFHAGTFGKYSAGIAQADRKGQVVLEGFNVTPGGAVRSLTVSTGRAVMPGLYFENDAPITLTADAVSSTFKRYVVLDADFATRTISASLVGTSATLPNLTQTHGSRWQMPIAQVTVAPSTTGIFASSAIVACKPIPHVTQPPITVKVSSPVNVHGGGVVKEILTTTVDDPGWPYVLESQSNAFVIGDSGLMRIQVLANGSMFATGRSIRLFEGTRDDVVSIGSSPVLTGRATVSMQADVLEGSGGAGSAIQPASYLRLTQRPA